MKQTTYWFRPKRYGWGFVPTTWQGWGMTLSLLAVILGSAYSTGFFSETGPNTEGAVRYILDICVFTTLFSLLACKKTKGRLAWRWGHIDDAAEDQEGPIGPQ